MGLRVHPSPPLRRSGGRQWTDARPWRLLRVHGRPSAFPPLLRHSHGRLGEGGGPRGSHAPTDTRVHSRAHTQARLLVDMHVLHPHAHVSRHRAACLGFGNAGVRGRHAVGPPAHAARSGCHELLGGSSATHLCCGLDETCPTRWPQRGLFPPPLQEASPHPRYACPGRPGPTPRRLRKRGVRTH